MKPQYRFWRNAFYALQGLKAAFAGEKSFRIECIVCAVGVGVSVILPVSLVWHFLLVGVLLMILCVECVNSAIEATIDLLSPDFHPLAKLAKDLGSAAVFISICVAVLCWGFALGELALRAF